MTTTNFDLLNASIQDLSFSKLFKAVTEYNEIYTLKSLTDISVADLQNLPGFTVHLLVELTDYLYKNDMINLLNHE